MIRVNCINLESRTERKNHIEIEFSDRHEFNLRIVQAIKHEVGAIGLWQSLIGVVKEMSLYDDEYLPSIIRPGYCKKVSKQRRVTMPIFSLEVSVGWKRPYRYLIVCSGWISIPVISLW